MKENAKVVKTLYSMMRDRGYSTSPQLKHQMYIFSADSLPTIEIRIFQEDKIGIGHIKNFVHPKCFNYIFVSPVGITPKARKTCKIINSTMCLSKYFAFPNCFLTSLTTCMSRIIDSVRLKKLPRF